MYICPSVNMYFQLGWLAFHLDNRDTDAIVAHPVTARYDVRLTGTGGNATWRETREIRCKISKAQTVSCTQGQGYQVKKRESERKWVIERTYSLIRSTFSQTQRSSILLATYNCLIPRFSVLSRLVNIPILFNTLNIVTKIDYNTVSLIYRWILINRS